MEKLTPAQQKIVDVLRDGGRCWSRFGWRSDPGSTTLMTKDHESLPCRYTSVSRLEDLGLVYRKQGAAGNEYFLKDTS